MCHEFFVEDVNWLLYLPPKCVSSWQILKRYIKVSLLGVAALWGDCIFSGTLGVIIADLCYVALIEDFSL